ncbi:hypothetical protein P5V15_000331 [Pogonomyrmex californicus]
MNIEQNAKMILKACKEQGLQEILQCSFLADCSAPNPPQRVLTTEQLSPEISIYYVKNSEEAFSLELKKFCLKNPIVILRHLDASVNIDLDLFSSKTLAQIDPHLNIEIREQNKCSPDENWDKGRKKKVWDCFSSLSRMTMLEYTRYQRRIQRQNNSDQMNMDEENKKLKFATNIDLSNKKKWKDQFDELMKLPPFLRVEDNSNMLSYVGEILGMNTLQLYMKVPGCRTPGHQENNNFCSVNLNIGPGDCEWFAVPQEYWGAMHTLCEQNNVNYLKDSWWPPNLNVLHENNIPVYRFIQKSGDIVWINVGCVHWVQSIGSCNNVAWNVGPFIVSQYYMAIERYEWNKLQRFKSIVPIVHLSWNLACDANVTNVQLSILIKNCLLLTMKQSYLILKFVKRKNVEVIHHGRRKDDHTPYCQNCYVEVFNVLFISKLKKNKPHEVYCIKCALKRSRSLRGFTCLKEYHLNTLRNIYDKFVLRLSSSHGSRRSMSTSIK